MAEVALYNAEQQQAAACATIGRVDDTGNMVPIKGRSPQEISYLSKLVASHQRIAMMGKMPVTVVNINPFRLMVNNRLFNGLTVPANKQGERYSAMVIANVRYEVDTGVDRNHTPLEFWPIQLGTEFVTQYADKGGVFIISGDLQKQPELEHTDEFKLKYDKADKQLVRNCFKLKRQADSEWNTPNRSGARNIHTQHRTAAKILFDRKLISAVPDWMNGEVPPEEVTADCPTCKAQTKKGQTVCAPCGRVLDPFLAFKNGDINEYHESLERLTREQVEELGVSAFVAETVDEKPARLKSGKSKPPSKFEVNQQKALEAEQKAAAKAAAKAEGEAGK